MTLNNLHKLICHKTKWHQIKQKTDPDLLMVIFDVINEHINIPHGFGKQAISFWLVGWLVGFNGISTSIGYLMPESFYTYIIYMICKCKFLGWWWLGFMANQPLKGHWMSNSDINVCVYINVKAFWSKVLVTTTISLIRGQLFLRSWLYFWEQFFKITPSCCLPYKKFSLVWLSFVHSMKMCLIAYWFPHGQFHFE